MEVAASDGVVDSGFRLPVSSPSDVPGAGSAPPSLSPSSEDNEGGKGIGLSMTAMHRAIAEREVSCVSEGYSDAGS